MMWLPRKTWIGIGLWVILGAGVVFGNSWHPIRGEQDGNSESFTALLRAQITPRPSWSYFYDDFGETQVIDEAGEIAKSASAYWWISAGGQLIVEDGIGKTIQGDLPADAYWRQRYSESKPESTNNGYHPQNTFRLVARTSWYNFRQHVYFRIVDDHLSASESRNASNGLLLFSHYQDQDNLYYAGIRVDGAAVIKKKWRGEYTTLAYQPVFEGEYDRDNVPNLLPKQQWIGVRMDTRSKPQGAVEITLYLDLNLSGNWLPVLSAVDADFAAGNVSPWIAGNAGIRTDFMDVEFDDYLIECFEDCR